LLIAITREVSPSITHCELTYQSREKIDLILAQSQHRQYQQALVALGCKLVTASAAPELPDAVFVEDTAIALDELAVITRPGAVSRRPECQSIAATLMAYRQLVHITPPGTLDGGDVLRVGKTLYVGKSGRSNPSGICQLQEVIEPHGYRVKAVDVHGCLHLKSAVSQIAPHTLLINPRWVEKSNFQSLDFVEIDPNEPHAANALLVGESLIYPASFPFTYQRLAARDIAVTEVDVSELQKAEGAVTCCSILLNVT
jgi:dimethylargininase